MPGKKPGSSVQIRTPPYLSVQLSLPPGVRLTTAPVAPPPPKKTDNAELPVGGRVMHRDDTLEQPEADSQNFYWNYFCYEQ